MLSVAEWEREQLGLDEQTKNLPDEAEILLREWKPQAILERRPKIKGQSKREHSFDFLLDGEYIDVIWALSKPLRAKLKIARPRLRR